MNTIDFAQVIQETLARNTKILLEDKSVREQPNGMPTIDQIAEMHCAVAANIAQAFTVREPFEPVMPPELRSEIVRLTGLIGSNNWARATGDREVNAEALRLQAIAVGALAIMVDDLVGTWLGLKASVAGKL